MSYTPTNWQTGDTITAEKLNNMESGIENANEPFLVTLTPTAQDFSGTMDKTGIEIRGAYDEGKTIFANLPSLNASFPFTQFLIEPYGIICGASIYYTISGQDVLIKVITMAEGNQYYTTIYPLTPMS